MHFHLFGWKGIRNSNICHQEAKWFLHLSWLVSIHTGNIRNNLKSPCAPFTKTLKHELGINKIFHDNFITSGIGIGKHPKVFKPIIPNLLKLNKQLGLRAPAAQIIALIISMSIPKNDHFLLEQSITEVFRVLHLGGFVTFYVQFHDGVLLYCLGDENAYLLYLLLRLPVDLYLVAVGRVDVDVARFGSWETCEYLLAK